MDRDIEAWEGEGGAAPASPGVSAASTSDTASQVETAGALVHQGVLIIPYGIADHATAFATVPLDEVLAAMQPGG